MSQIYPFDPANLQGNVTTNKVEDPKMRYGWGFKFKDPQKIIKKIFNNY